MCYLIGMAHAYRPGWTWYHGTVCPAHPELQGRRHLSNRRCALCPPPGLKRSRKLSNRAVAQQQGNTYYRGEICAQHPELQGVRRTLTHHCVGSHPERMARDRAQRRVRYAADPLYRRKVLGHNYKSRAKLMASPSYRFTYNTRCRVATAVRRGAKTDSTLALLGTPSWAVYRKYLQAQFASGMTWENYGTVWHVDHIIPLSRFDLSCPINQRVAFCYENTRPLWATDNISRGNRIAPSDIDILL